VAGRAASPGLGHAQMCKPYRTIPITIPTPTDKAVCTPPHPIPSHLDGERVVDLLVQLDLDLVR
jgi:hypothetical protein